MSNHVQCFSAPSNIYASPLPERCYANRARDSRSKQGRAFANRLSNVFSNVGCGLAFITRKDFNKMQLENAAAYGGVMSLSIKPDSEGLERLQSRL